MSADPRRSNALGRAFVSDRSGASLVEFALILPVLLVMLFGTFELGWALQCGSSVRSAVETASRQLISNPSMTSTDLQAAVTARLSGLPIKNVQVSLAKEWVTGNAQIARVSWTYQYAMALPYVPQQTLKFDSSLVVPMASS